MKAPNQFDHYLGDEGPAALVIREHLMPVEGRDGVVFPATFASGDGFPGGYNIDPLGSTAGSNICLIDSVGSQANRIEPMFIEDKYKALVPQVVVKAGDKEVNLLEAGHRAGDAVVRCSELQQTLQDAFRAFLKGDASPLARIAPTSLVFGVWDSRDTQAKLPRLLASTIRAFDVRHLRRGAVYIPPLDYSELDVFSDEDKAKAEGDKKSPLAKRGFVHVPATGSPGGVIADGGIRRDATLGLAALRLVFVGKDAEKTLALRRYILGLALTAFTYRPTGYLRQGCLLVLDPDKPREFVEVHHDGTRKPVATTHEQALAYATNEIALKVAAGEIVATTHEQALAYATAAAGVFGVGEGRVVAFDKERASRDVKGDGDAKPKGKKGKKSDAQEPS